MRTPNPADAGRPRPISVPGSALAACSAASTSSAVPSRSIFHGGPFATCAASTTCSARTPGDPQRLGQIGRVQRPGADHRRGTEREQFALLPHLDQPDRALLHDHSRLFRHPARFEPRMARAERRMACERHLAARIEDPHPVVGTGIARREQECRFGETEPLGEPQHLRVAQPLAGMHDPERIAAQGRRAEHIHQIEFIAAPPASPRA